MDEDAVAGFALQFDPGEIDALAARFGPMDESAVEAAGAAARARGFYTVGEFAFLCAWKTPRSRPLVASNSPSEVEATTRLALAPGVSDGARFAALLTLRGVGGPSASVLLHFPFPGDYPILDVRAVESLGAKAGSSYTVAFWERYVLACRTLAARHGVSLRTLDKALWQHSKERSAATQGLT
jgi:hypothetical protein